MHSKLVQVFSMDHKKDSGTLEGTKSLALKSTVLTTQLRLLMTLNIDLKKHCEKRKNAGNQYFLERLREIKTLSVLLTTFSFNPYHTNPNFQQP